MTAQKKKPARKRAEAYQGHGYGTQRRDLQKHARDHIETCLSTGYYCEAIAIIESVITDRLESRIAFLSNRPGYGFQTLGGAITALRRRESDSVIKSILEQIVHWRRLRNAALHEMVKVEADQPPLTWESRMKELKSTATDGYDLLKDIYHAVADLNPKHLDRVFPRRTTPEHRNCPGTA